MTTGHIDAAFAADRSERAGVLLLGESTGLLNPFTGDGIEPALSSGVLAAEAIAAHPRAPAAAVTGYSRALARDFVGYYDTATRATRRYHLTWRALSASITSDNPFFARSRRALVLPGGLADPASGTFPADRHSLMAEPFLLACTEIAVAAAGKHWPFAASLITRARPPARQALRPARIFAGALSAEGKPLDIQWAGVAAAIELVMIGALALTATAPSPERTARGVDWPSATAVLVGDFLLSRASLLIAEQAPDLSGPFTDWLTELVEARARQLRPDGPPRSSLAFFGALFEFPARVGAALADCCDRATTALRKFGRSCGAVFVYAEDHLALTGRQTRLDTTMTGLLSSKLSAFPGLTDHHAFGAAPHHDPVLCRQAATLARNRCRAGLEQAHGFLDQLPDTLGTGILRAFATHLAGPCGPGDTTQGRNT
ncbi:hypothetical protein [Amycolatopsis sp. NPDC059021]|uniref:hypothetical protein n=1 Tax=Amycolatopsis sp. NPDC059021 TaxID=3346704 RepID=UPI00367345A1